MEMSISDKVSTVAALWCAAASACK